jgi:hypothetical protein
MLGRALQQNSQLEEGAKEIQESQRLRRGLRQNAASESAGDRPMGEFSGRGAKKHLSEHERAQARAFLNQMSPLIGEAYFNLGGITAHNGDGSAAAQLRQKARAWDPSLSQGEKQGQRQ